MSKRIFALLISGGIIVSSILVMQGFFGDIGQLIQKGAEDIGKTIKKGAEDVAETTIKTAEGVVKKTQEGVEDLAKKAQEEAARLAMNWIKDVILKLNIKDGLKEGSGQLYAGADKLRAAAPTSYKEDDVNLHTIPKIVDKMYVALQEYQPLVQSGVQGLKNIIKTLKSTKEDIEKNKMITDDIKNPLLSALNTLETTLPVLLQVLKNLEGAFATTIQERQEVVAQLRDKTEKAIGYIDSKDIAGRTLTTRMRDLATGLGLLVHIAEAK